MLAILFKPQCVWLPWWMVQHCGWHNLLWVSLYPPHNEVVGGVYWFHSVRPSVRQSVRPSVPRPSRIPCPLCSFYSSGWIHFIFMHLIKQLQKVCPVQSYLQNFKIWHFGNFLKFVTSVCVVLTWDLMWTTSMGNHGAAGGISECWRSSCSSYYICNKVWCCWQHSVDTEWDWILNPWGQAMWFYLFDTDI